MSYMSYMSYMSLDYLRIRAAIDVKVCPGRRPCQNGAYVLPPLHVLQKRLGPE